MLSVSITRCFSKWTYHHTHFTWPCSTSSFTRLQFPHFSFYASFLCLYLCIFGFAVACVYSSFSFNFCIHLRWWLHSGALSSPMRRPLLYIVLVYHSTSRRSRPSNRPLNDFPLACCVTPFRYFLSPLRSSSFTHSYLLGPQYARLRLCAYNFLSFKDLYLSFSYFTFGEIMRVKSWHFVVLISDQCSPFFCIRTPRCPFFL